jgi:hypothetical protein
VGAADNLPPASAPVTADALVWPPPATDLDVLWLDDAPPPASSVAPPASSVAAPADRSVPLSQLRSGVTVEWHDAVALLQQVIDQLAPDRTRPPAGSLPGLDEIAIESSGRLAITLGPPGEAFVKGLGRLLNEVLQSNPAPANLRLLAWQAASDSAAPLHLDEFGRQLAGWERPNRAAALRALYERAASAKPGAGVPEIRVAPIAAPVAEPATIEHPPAPVDSRRKRLIVYASIAAGVFIAAAALVLFSTRTPAARAIAAPKVLVAREAAAPEAPAIAASRGLDIELPHTTRGRRLRGITTARGASMLPSGRHAQSTASTPNRLTGNSRAADADTLEQPPLELFGEAAPIPIAPSIYTSDDRAVVEPQLIRPYLPFRPRVGTPPDALGVLELVIDTHGAVESVHLNSPDNRYRERWWVFAAKNWQFRPAMKNGVPVRFLQRIPLTDLNMLEPQ